MLMSDPMKSLRRDGQGRWGGFLSLHAVNIHTHTQHIHSLTHAHTRARTPTPTHTHSSLRGCHISLYLVAWCELWPCHSIEGLWVCVFVGCVCISDPLFTHLFIKQPLTPNQCCPECCCMCVNAKMIYRNIPKIKPGGGGTIVSTARVENTQ